MRHVVSPNTELSRTFINIKIYLSSFISQTCNKNNSEKSHTKTHSINKNRGLHLGKRGRKRKLLLVWGALLGILFSLLYFSKQLSILPEEPEASHG